MPLTEDSRLGVVHGNVIQLADDLGLPDGQEVLVSLRPVDKDPAGGDGIRHSAGAWDDDPAGVDAFLEETRKSRKASRQALDP